METQPNEEATSELLAHRTLTDYRQGREHIFRSEQSLQWFVRQNRERLVATGALRLIAGRWHALPARFDAVVLEAGQAAAKNQAAA